MNYNDLRHFADSYGLLLMGAVYLVLVGWTFRRTARADHRRAATMILEEEDRNDG